MNLADLIAMRNSLQADEQTLRKSRLAVEADIARLLGARGHTRYGDDIYRTGPASSKTVCDDPEGFSEWAAQQSPAVIRKAFNPNYVRKSGLPDGVFDTFFHAERSEDRVLQVVPVGRAPKFMQACAEGAVVLDGEELGLDEVEVPE